MKGEPIFLEVHWPDGKTAQIGTWSLPGELCDNYENQKSVGWHAFFSLVQGAESVVVKRGQPSPSGDIRACLLRCSAATSRSSRKMKTISTSSCRGRSAYG